jgi:hypothetical protein
MPSKEDDYNKGFNDALDFVYKAGHRILAIEKRPEVPDEFISGIRWGISYLTGIVDTVKVGMSDEEKQAIVENYKAHMQYVP